MLAKNVNDNAACPVLTRRSLVLREQARSYKCLPTIAVDAPVDNLFAVVYTPGASCPAALCTKNNQPNWRFLLGFFPGGRTDLPPKSVGASVDKMFAVGWGPYR